MLTASYTILLHPCDEDNEDTDPVVDSWTCRNIAHLEAWGKVSGLVFGEDGGKRQGLEEIRRNPMPAGWRDLHPKIRNALWYCRDGSVYPYKVQSQ